MAGDQPFPIQCQNLLDRILRLERIKIDHAPARQRTDRKKVDYEDELLLRQAHDDGAVGVVESDVGQLERGVTELNRPLLVHRFIGQRRRRILEHCEAFLRLLVGDDLRAGILERLAAGDVVVVVVAVDQVLDRLVGDLLDFVDIGCHRLRASVTDGIGGDHAVSGDDEHRLVVGVAEDVDVIGAFHLGGRKRERFWLLRLLLRLGCPAQDNCSQCCACDDIKNS